MAQVFISYSRKDQDFVLKLARDLRHRDADIWLDQFDILPGERWDDQIQTALDSCRYLLIVLSADSVDSQNVKDEISFAVEEKKTVIPVFYRDTTLPFRLRRLQYVDFRADYQQALDQLLSLIPRSPLSEPAASAVQPDTTTAIPGIASNDKSGTGFVEPRPLPVAEQVPARPWRGKKALYASVAIVLGVGLTFLWLSRQRPLSSTAGMVKVDGGSYTVGTDVQVELAEFWIDRYEVTNSQYQAFSGKTLPTYWVDGAIPAGLENHPVREIGWEAAKRYCQWLGKRLPTEAEWEVAARGPYRWLYPWGNKEDSVKRETQGTYPVGKRPMNRSYFGAFDMAGNVWEWVQHPYTPVSPGQQVIRGGAYDIRYDMQYAIAGASAMNSKDPMVVHTGMRCAADGARVHKTRDEALALQDDFSSLNSGWPEVQGDSFIVNYHPPEFYHVESRKPEAYVTAFFERETFAHFILETEVFVDATNTDNTQGNFQYGLAIRHQSGHFYAFVISAKTRQWQILRGKLEPGSMAGAFDALESLQGAREESIQGASEAMADRLMVMRNGTELSFFINGKLVSTVTVDDYKTAHVGFLVETLADVTKVHIHYNWLTVQKIEPF